MARCAQLRWDESWGSRRAIGWTHGHRDRWRLRADAQALKRYLTAGTLGRVYYARAGWLRRAGIPGIGGWFTQKAMSGGGPLIDLGVHMLDLSMWLLDYPTPVAVSGATYAEFGPRGRGTWVPYDPDSPDRQPLKGSLITLSGEYARMQEMFRNLGFGLGEVEQLFQLFELPFSQTGAGMGPFPILDQLADDFDARGFDEAAAPVAAGISAQPKPARERTRNWAQSNSAARSGSQRHDSSRVR